MHKLNGLKSYKWKPQQPVRPLKFFGLYFLDLAFHTSWFVTTVPNFFLRSTSNFVNKMEFNTSFVVPYHLSSSGEAESFILTFKAAIRKTEQKITSSSSHTVSVKIQNSPSSSDKTPAEFIFGRQILTCYIPHSRKIVRKVKKRQGKERNRQENWE